MTDEAGSGTRGEPQKGKVFDEEDDNDIANKEANTRGQKNQKHTENTMVTGEGDNGSTRENKIQQLCGKAPLARIYPCSAAGDLVGTQSLDVPAPHTQQVKHQQLEPHQCQAPPTNMEETDQPDCIYPASFATKPTDHKEGVVTFIATAGAHPWPFQQCWV